MKKGMHFRCLILSGGGNRGIAYGGAIQALEHQKILKNIKCFVGSSVGALASGLLAVGYTANEIEETIISINFKDFKTDWGLTKQFRHFYNYFGRHTTKRMEKIVSKLLQKHYELPKITFQQLHDFVGTTLVVTACCINTGITEYLSRVTAPDMPIAHAICMSMCVPTEFEPYKIDNMLYCDGSTFGHSIPREFPEHKSFGLDLKERECLVIRTHPTTELKPIETQQHFAEAMLNGLYLALHMAPIFRYCITLTCDAPMFKDEIPRTEKRQIILEARQTTESWLASRSSDPH